MFNKESISKANRIALVCLLIPTTGLFAQSVKKISSEDSIAICEAEINQVDIIDVCRKIIKKPAKEKCEPSKQAWKFHTSALPAFGYSLVTGFGGVLASTTGFYTDIGLDAKLSAIDASISYTQKNQIILPILSNIWTRGNKVNLLGDWRFYKFPENTYGLGGHTKLSDHTRVDYECLIIHEAALKHIGATNFYAGIAYNLNYHWNISESGYAQGVVTDFAKYGRTSCSTSSGISVNALYDGRKNSINPSQSFYASVSFCVFSKHLLSSTNYRSLIIDVRKYFKPGKNSKNILAFWSYNWFTFNGNVPYLDLPSTAWDPYANVGRGYIQSRFRGKNMIYLEAEYRFAILKNGLLGGVVFTNAQSVTDWPSNKFTTIFPAFGSGIRIKLNKHSEANLSLDYAFGIDGSNGLFVNLGEIF